MTRLPWKLGLIVALGAAFAAPAAADEAHGTYAKDQWPLAATRRPLTLAGGMVELRGDTLGVNLSKNFAGDPTFIAPDLFYGISDKFTVGITHQIGFCVSGDTCDKTYNDIAAHALFAILQAGNFNAAVHGGLVFSRLSKPAIMALDVGLAARIVGGPIALRFDPTFDLGLVGRTGDDTVGDGAVSLDGIYQDETFRMPVGLEYQLNFQTMLFLSTGIMGPLSGFGDGYRVPIGLGAVFAVNNRMDFGTEFQFLNAAGKNSTADLRMLFVRFALRI